MKEKIKNFLSDVGFLIFVLGTFIVGVLSVLGENVWEKMKNFFKNIWK